jgi:hypothetical protein
LLLCSSYLSLGVPNWTVIYINTVPRHTFQCMHFHIFPVTPMDMCYLSKLQLFILYLNHKKHLSNTLFALLFLALIKYKNIITFLHSHTKPKNTFPASYLLYCTIIYFIAYHIYFTYIHTLCLTTTQWSWGHKTRKLFCRLLDKERRELF